MPQRTLSSCSAASASSSCSSFSASPTGKPEPPKVGDLYFGNKVERVETLIFDKPRFIKTRYQIFCEGKVEMKVDHYENKPEPEDM
mmetsp:Transcript_879/g.1964  ORF Transcript_879/g.1964 Transcript_879/m.1964 type:complete len:86 (-) Transcript_879:519-776(-)|eukprot:CAMPEP_0113462102 /NCGR_PEP_ID=MMETSP0014_2-20120614/11903_1 /TAXON_ID=2857 /ORGANISM="Nitzschia sp." /LENGTH=85 /DNA_ID=CAMNT_0000353923 /DNA_START=133 /DNA_END=390 /DNA_ORIENTATION=- /assembly_acc=CAM_ASM_000159